MRWIFDLLIEKWKKDKEEGDWEPEPLHIQDNFYLEEKKEDEDEEKRVIIIDL